MSDAEKKAKKKADKKTMVDSTDSGPPLEIDSDSGEAYEPIPITQMYSAREVIHLTETPRVWDVPHNGRDTVYLLDLNDDPNEWKDKDGNLLSMATIIKSKVSVCQVHVLCSPLNNLNRTLTLGVVELEGPRTRRSS